MVCVGGYWFWFFIRVDAVAEGSTPLRIVRADLFVLSLLGSATLGLIWAYLQARGNPAANVFFGLYVIATTVLFGSVPWSKFAHMFFKPAAAFEKRVSLRKRLPEQPAGARRQTRAVRQRPRATPALLNQRIHYGDNESHAHIRLHDPLRRLRTLCRHLPVRHHAHRQDLPPRLQHRAEHVLGVLLLREGVSAERHRCPRLRRLRPAGSQRPRAARRSEGNHFVAAQVPRRPREELRVADPDDRLGIDQGAGRVRCARPEEFAKQELAHEPEALNIQGGLPALRQDQLKRGVA